jgi:3',5'-cyclic AMP phosphodiesterase CpdA
VPRVDDAAARRDETDLFVVRFYPLDEKQTEAERHVATRHRVSGMRLRALAPRAAVFGLVGYALCSAVPGVRSQPAAPVSAHRVQDQEPVVLIGAGDIANCAISGGSGALATARLLDQIPGTVFTVGDHAYPSGTAQQFRECYEPSWGRHKARTRPAPGNHDYLTADAKPYYEYFGENAGPERRGYYSYTLGSWHIVSLNSFIAADRDSPQIEWLRTDLKENPATCTLAYWHLPVFSSGPHGSEPRTSAHMRDAWRVLYEYGADVVVNGHDHDYERFAPQDPKGKADPERGIRQFVVGTGGGGLYEFRQKRRNSEARSNRSYGVLKFTLRQMDYSWEFLVAAGAPFQDTGTAACTALPTPATSR